MSAIAHFVAKIEKQLRAERKWYDTDWRRALELCREAMPDCRSSQQELLYNEVYKRRVGVLTPPAKHVVTAEDAPICLPEKRERAKKKGKKARPSPP